ncbi:MAG: hypothetical protein IKX51_08110 [Bacteroidales bacterium]|nr:hypothetical protein [Bacteroidales bacterium]
MPSLALTECRSQQSHFWNVTRSVEVYSYVLAESLTMAIILSPIHSK